jgi:hypothetical protein
MVSSNDLLGTTMSFLGFKTVYWLASAPRPFHHPIISIISSLSSSHHLQATSCRAASNRSRRPAPHPPTRLPVTSQVHHHHLPLPAPRGRLGSGLLRRSRPRARHPASARLPVRPPALPPARPPACPPARAPASGLLHPLCVTNQIKSNHPGRAAGLGCCARWAAFRPPAKEAPLPGRPVGAGHFRPYANGLRAASRVCELQKFPGLWPSGP